MDNSGFYNSDIKKERRSQQKDAWHSEYGSSYEETRPLPPRPPEYPTRPLTEPSPQSSKRRIPLSMVAIVVVLVVALIVGILKGFTGQTPSNPALSTPVKPFQCTTTSQNPVTLSMYYDTETQEWMNDEIGNFNRLCQGRITVELHGEVSGQVMQDILNGQIQPDIWSPAASIWLGLLNDQWQKNHAGSNIISALATDTPSLVKSPVVIAMWEPMAEVLGWPNKPILWSDIAELSANPQGWAAYGHPEWGNFKFAHTNPDYSNSGLNAFIAENYAAVHKTSGLTIDDVDSQATQTFVRAIESSVIHYGDSVGALADEMFNKGISYLSAVVMDESLVAEANSNTKYTHLAHPVVAIYPQNGNFMSDHPFAIPQASWVTPDKKNAALLLRNYLRALPQQQKALRYYFRPATFALSNGSNAPLDKAHGVDPMELNSPGQLNPPETPDIGTTLAVQKRAQNERNKIDVMLILDHSGSMAQVINGESKLDKAKQGLLEFASLLGDSDSLGLTVFSDGEDVLAPVNPLSPDNRQQISKLVGGITAGGYTLLYNTIADQVVSLQAQPLKHIKFVVVLTDGINEVKNNVGSLSLNELIAKIKPDGPNQGEGVQVYTIAYGNPADTTTIDPDALMQIAGATTGLEYSGTPQNIVQVYNQIIKSVG